MTQVWWKDVFRGLFGMLDSVIYGFISTAYTLLNEIAHFRVFDDTTLQEFSTRIYAILGIIMLFKLSFSFINYMINPDAFTDKQQGVQNIVKNIIIMFIMLILSPWVFTKLWDIQGAILDEQVLARFVFGTVSSTETNLKYSEECDDAYKLDNDEDKAGDFISIMILRGFYQPYVFEDIYSDESFVKDLKNEDEYSDTITALCRASTVGASSMLSSDIYNETLNPNTNVGKKYYIMEYHFGISTAVGVVVLLLLVNFCIDVGARMVKLSFLQLIAPIPIISYIDPASGKNGMFMKWLKEVGKTWVSVFIKLLAIFFAVSIIQHVGDLIPVGNKNREAGIWVQIFVIIGALIFAKQLPDLIQNITGIKMEGGFNLNPFKKIENEALGGKLIANTGRGAIMAGANMAVSGIGQMASNGYNFAKTKSNLRKAIAKEKDEGKKAKLQRQYDNMGLRRWAATTAGGFAGGAVRGARTGYTSGRQGKYNVIENARQDITKGNEARNNRTNIRNYNSEVDYKAKQEKQKFKNEYEAIKARTDLTAEEQKKLLKERKQDYKDQKKDYKEQHYGFFERNVGERLDQWSGVKNEYGGVGYYDKQIGDLDKKISNNEAQETAMRHAVANYCANNSIDQIMVEDYHKKYSESKNNIEQKYKTKRDEMFETAYQEKERSDFQSKYQEKAQEEYNRLLEENGGAPITDEQQQQISESATRKAKEEIKQEVEKDIYKKAEEEVLEEVYKEMEEKYGLSEQEIKEQYKQVKSQLDNISKVDEETKELRKSKKEYTELLSARQNAEKK